MAAIGDKLIRESLNLVTGVFTLRDRPLPQSMATPATSWYFCPMVAAKGVPKQR